MSEGLYRMIISHKHKFIFIKTAKTAGTSIEIALSKICGPDDIITPITKEDEDHRQELGYRGAQNYKAYSFKGLIELARTKEHKFYNHISAAEIKNKISPEIWDNYYKFCFERNPFDKIISWYYWAGQGSPSLQDFILSGQASKVKGFNLYTINSIPVVDRVYKYEEFNNALSDLSRRLQLSEELKLPAKKAKGNVRKDRRHYREVLSDEGADRIAKIFAREIKLFGYKY
jgi:hypothetical protein